MAFVAVIKGIELKLNVQIIIKGTLRVEIEIKVISKVKNEKIKENIALLRGVMLH